MNNRHNQLIKNQMIYLMLLEMTNRLTNNNNHHRLIMRIKFNKNKIIIIINKMCLIQFKLLKRNWK